MTEWVKIKQGCLGEPLRLYGEIDKLSLSDSAKVGLFRVAVEISQEAATLLAGLKQGEEK